MDSKIETTETKVKEFNCNICHKKFNDVVELHQHLSKEGHNPNAKENKNQPLHYYFK